MTRQNATQTKSQTPTTSPLSKGGILQRKCESCGNHTVAGGECESCGKKKIGLQRKLTIGASNDPLELEADRVADQVMAVPANSAISHSSPRIQRFTGQPSGQADMEAPASVESVLSSPGRPLDPALQQDMGQRFGHDFSRVRVHTGAAAERSAREVNANAYTVGQDIVFRAGRFVPETNAGRRLIAHELTHVVQQNYAMKGTNSTLIQRERASPSPLDQFTGPLTDVEWQLVEMWQRQGEVEFDALTENPENNALVIAGGIFCNRSRSSLILDNPGEDPLLCLDSEVTKSDHRVKQLVQHVTARGQIINWVRVSPDQRMLYVMNLLVNTYKFPANGAAGLVGNLWSESGVLPSRVEGSAISSPMRASNRSGKTADFTSEQIMDRDSVGKEGPDKPGIGLAQWTTGSRRLGLFKHVFAGRQQGTAILFNMDAQVDYLVTELKNSFIGVYNVLTRGSVSLNDASDEVVFRYEAPGSILDSSGKTLPRTDPAVQNVFGGRRSSSQKALQVFLREHP
jgi:hypothetical protein